MLIVPLIKNMWSEIFKYIYVPVSNQSFVTKDKKNPQYTLYQLFLN